MMPARECGMQNESVQDLGVRTKQYALRIIKCYGALSRNVVAQVLGRQLLRMTKPLVISDSANFDEGPAEVVEEPGEVVGAGQFVFGGTALLGAAGLITGNAEALHTAKDLAVALTATSAAVWALKYTTHRERPDGSNHYSFPSGHTAVAFAAASVIDKRYGGVAGWGAYTAAALAGEARIADNHHYLSDVVAGAILGTVIGHLVAHAP